MKLQQVIDELAIRDLVARHVDAIHRRDSTAWGATWAEDARWILPDVTDPDSELVMDGHATIVAGWIAAMQGYPFVAHMVHSGHIEFDADDIRGRWYVSEVVEDEDGDRHHFYGVYNDVYAKVDDRWLFRERIFSLLYMGTASWEGNTFSHPQGFEL